MDPESSTTTSKSIGDVVLQDKLTLISSGGTIGGGGGVTDGVSVGVFEGVRVFVTVLVGVGGTTIISHPEQLTTLYGYVNVGVSVAVGVGVGVGTGAQGLSFL